MINNGGGGDNNNENRSKIYNDNDDGDDNDDNDDGDDDSNHNDRKNRGNGSKSRKVILIYQYWKNTMAQRSKRKCTPRELMELAVKEGERSIPEHDKKEDPFVGAIVTTKDGEILAMAHRGELRAGEHCEFTLLERKLRDRNLCDCVLYVTLEPCTDEARNEQKGKYGCATHIIRARIGTVYVGIEDPDPRVATQGIRYLIANHVVVHPFDADLQERIRQRNARFVKEKEEEAKAIHVEVKGEAKTILEETTLGASITGLSEDALQKFIAMSQLLFQYPSTEFNLWATDYGLLETNASGGDPKPTGLGIMLFGKRPSLLYPQAVFKVEIHYDRGEPEIRDFEDPLVFQLPRIIEYVKDKALRLPIDISHGERVEVPDFPLVSCQPCNVVNYVVCFLHNHLRRIGYEEIHRDTC